MADTGEGKKEEADYKRLHSFPLIRVRRKMSCVFTSVTDMQCYLCSSPPSKTRFLPLTAAVGTCTLAVPYRDFSHRHFFCLSIKQGNESARGVWHKAII